MLSSTVFFVAASALATLASAQLAPGTNYSTSGALEIDVTQIDPVLRQTWCTAQTAQCPLICGSNAFPNTCNSTTLQWNCTCSNGNMPNISDYQQTVPAFICNQWRANCVDAHPNDLDGINGCLSVVCGNKTKSAATASSSASAVSSAATTSSTGSGSAGAATSSSASASATASQGAAMAIQVAQNYGTGIMLTGLLAVFGLAL